MVRSSFTRIADHQLFSWFPEIDLWLFSIRAYARTFGWLIAGTIPKAPLSRWLVATLSSRNYPMVSWTGRHVRLEYHGSVQAAPRHLRKDLSTGRTCWDKSVPTFEWMRFPYPCHSALLFLLFKHTPNTFARYFTTGSSCYFFRETDSNVSLSRGQRKLAGSLHKRRSRWSPNCSCPHG